MCVGNLFTGAAFSLRAAHFINFTVLENNYANDEVESRHWKWLGEFVVWSNGHDLFALR